MSYKNIGLLFCLLALINAPALDLTFDSKLTGWQSGFRRQVKFDNSDGSGAAVRIENKAGNKRASIYRVVALEPKTKYKITFFVKGKEISNGKGEGARITLNAGKKWSRITAAPGNQPDTGTFDWKKGSGIIDTALYPDSKIRIELSLIGEGTVWFKDVKIEKISPAAQSDLTDALKFDRNLTGWQTSAASRIAIDENIKIDKAAVRLSGGGRLWKILELEPNSQYELTFYIKGEKISTGKNHGARIVLNSGKKWSRITAAPGNQPDTGTFDWKKGSGIIDTALYPDCKIRLELNLMGEGTVWFDDLVIVKKKSNSTVTDSGYGINSFHKAYDTTVKEAILVPQGINGFFEPNEPVKINLFVDGKKSNYEYDLLVKNESGVAVFKSAKKVLSPEFMLPGQPCGYYSVTCNIYSADKKVYTIQGGFAVTPVPGMRDKFFAFGFGVLPELHDGYKRAGCGTIVLKHSVGNLLKGRNPKKLVDYMVNTAYKPFLESGDFNLELSLGTSIPKQNNFRSPEDIRNGMPLLTDDLIKLYMEVVTLLAEKTNIKYWSIGQETPSNATMSHKYAGTWSEAMSNCVILTRLISRKLRSIDPAIKIAAGGNNIPEKTNDIEPIQMGDLVNDFDIYYIDAYTGNWDLTKKRATIPEVALMDFYKAASALSIRLGKGKYIANDETGYSINYGAPFDRGLAVQQAYFTARSLIISKAAPVTKYELFRPNGYHTDPGKDSAMHMATLWKTVKFGKKYYHVPLPGSAMFATAASELAFTKIEQEIINGSVYSYVFSKPDGSTLVTLWNIEKNQPFDIKLPQGSKVLNMYGRNITGKPLVISQEPLYITIPAPADQAIPLISQAIFANTPEFKCIASDDIVYVRSMLRDTREITIQMPGQTPVKAKIFPDKINSFNIKTTAPGKLISGSRAYDIPLETLPVCTLKRVSSIAQLSSGKSGLLKVPEHVQPIEALQPERSFFKSELNPNGHNISVKYYLGYDENNFYMVAEVDDPVHLQRHTDKNIWRDDSLQLVLASQKYAPSVLLSDAESRPSSEYNFCLALTSKGVQLVKLLGKNSGLVNYPASVTRKNGITRYEVTIPWNAVGGKAERIGFLVWDNNSAAHPSAPYRLEITPGIAGGADSSKLARIKYE